MAEVPLVRATHLNVYLDVLREIGDPIRRLWDLALVKIADADHDVLGENRPGGRRDFEPISRPCKARNSDAFK